MSIDKDSNGVPEIDLKRRTTKVNVSMILGILIFFAVAIAVGFWVERQFG